ncbi:MAG TPA: nitroreductase family protein [Bacteroidales bacterium]|nr:nitroreductase family protein [Bacteroidales bacterium]HCI56347.1 nitroreductase family protein [Bacteroidales bacterium]HOU96144.1 nitroreductase family protein [Bacteroidales bacterium]HQG37278.1 nitroreductase family protein [Bacteroidales bacterium]HQG53738.1 nitroreductase family protein [Bacteroidales bacterium]
MELYEGLLTRRSIRKYTGEKIDEKDIELIIKAGMYAPSANNRRPWHFIVIADRNVLDKIMKFHPNASMLKEASHAIVVCGDLEKQHAAGYYLLDCSAATQNILLAAHSLGFGAVWVGIEPRQERVKALTEILNLPVNIRPVALVSIGVPAEKPETMPHRFEPDKIHLNNWGESWAAFK